MTDVFNRLLVTSDPIISSIRKLPQKPLKELGHEVIELLKPPKISFDICNVSTTSISESESESHVSFNSDDDEIDFCH